MFKEINKDSSIKFPIKVDIALPAHKVSLLLQAELCGMDFPTAEQYGKHKNAFNQEKHVVLQNVNRLIRCIIDCQLERQDSIAARHGLELARSFSARVWDNSPLQLKQLDGIGNVAVRKLANAGINSIETLETTEPHRIELAVGKNPPFGMKLLSQLEKFPKLRVSAKIVGKEVKAGRPVAVKLRAEVGFVNEKPPSHFQKKQIYVCFLAETNDGQLIDFQRISANKLTNGHDVMMTAHLTSPMQFVTCYVMCEDIAGTLRSAEVRPDLPPALFPPIKFSVPLETKSFSTRDMFGEVSQFNDDELDDGDLLAAGKRSQHGYRAYLLTFNHQNCQAIYPGKIVIREQQVWARQVLLPRTEKIKTTRRSGNPHAWPTEDGNATMRARTDPRKSDDPVHLSTS